jgi:hypothetical protein
MQAKPISHTSIQINDEVIIIIHHDGEDWHGIVKELSPVEELVDGIDNETGRVIKLACEEGEKELLLIDGDPVYLIERPVFKAK